MEEEKKLLKNESDCERLSGEAFAGDAGLDAEVFSGCDCFPTVMVADGFIRDGAFCVLTADLFVEERRMMEAGIFDDGALSDMGVSRDEGARKCVPDERRAMR